MSMRSANWSRETKMEKSGLWTRRSRAEHSRSLQSRPADGGTCRIMSPKLCHWSLDSHCMPCSADWGAAQVCWGAWGAAGGQ